ncbi:Plasmid stabilization system protein ParE [Salinimicrobium catena]|uniref:Plasmid stabilization system protein ParE n=1 Tax=Salinimicrobium catena TaxID=390640 RepID=A0A1H5GVG4_9FLAO|nr:type II toxin-antitoxin system RelE/ParE family toxin [Salinimicrobium catena]SDK65998.1 Plasmid stabilization system protein ParE [Salinimicrobium catena]SEE19687.1 Plasmid stabilization system protein ParE [Salinimicrobium catena]
MTFEIIWSDFAERQLDLIFLYYLENAGKRTAIRMVQDIVNESNSLKKDPFIGQKEELLIGREIIYRYLLKKNFKIIYSVDQVKGFIKIADVFDTRQDPAKINRTQ